MRIGASLPQKTGSQCAENFAPECESESGSKEGDGAAAWNQAVAF